MKNIAKKIGLEKTNVKTACLFKRAKVGPHLGLILDRGKANTILIGITHAKALNTNINTIDCEFSSIIDKVSPHHNDIKYAESRALLTIVNNETLTYKNPILLSNLKYSTGLTHYPEQEKLKSTILFRSKIIFLSDKYNSKDPSILYQTRTKTEIVSLKNEERIIELVGLKSYDEYFKPLIDLDLGENRSSIADILLKKIDNDGVEGLMKILKDIPC